METSERPNIIENREFVELEEEDIQRLNREEREKFRDNPFIRDAMNAVEAELGAGGKWEEHWLALDESGRRIYARIYYTEDRAAAVTSDGRVISEYRYPEE